MILTVPLVIFLLSSLSVADELKQNGEECSCFLTNGSSSGYFTYHRFHDFRNVQTNFTGIPSVIESYDDDANLVATSNFFGNYSGWNGDWDIQTWNNSDQLSPDNFETGDATVLMQNSAANVYIESSNDSNSNYSTYLTLRTTRLPSFQSVAEIDSTRGNYLHLSARFLARITGSPGACAGMFTYLTSPKPQAVQEIDIEILTSGPRSVVQYTNQPSRNSHGDSISGATTNTSLPNEIDWTQWNVYRLDWGREASTWFVNGEEVARIGMNVPRRPSMLILNMWGDGGEWTGNMSVGEEAVLQVQWIEVAFNTSGGYAGANSKRGIEAAEVEVEERDGHGAGGHLLRKRGREGCAVVCGIDDVRDIGTPILLVNNSSPAPRTFMPVDLGTVSLIPWVMIVLIGMMGMLAL